MPMTTNPFVTHRKKPVPKYQAGDPLGDLTVTDKQPVHIHRGLTKKQWHYEVRCVCGHVQVLSQDQLRTRRCCDECLADKRSQQKVKCKAAPIKQVRW